MCSSCTNINVTNGVEAFQISQVFESKDKNKCKLTKDLVSSVEKTKNVIEVVTAVNVNTTENVTINFLI